MMKGNDLVLAIPKGRILKEAVPLLKTVGIEPEAEFNNPHSRKLRFETNDFGLNIIRVRSFDVATFVALGGAQLGFVGSDVLMEFDYPATYAPLDLEIGKCRLIVAQTKETLEIDTPSRRSSITIATKYPEVTKRHFEARGVQAECIKLNGAMELAPALNLSRRIVDLVDTGKTLAVNGLEEIEHIANVSSRLVVNRAALKTRPKLIGGWIKRFTEAVNAEKIK